MAAWDAYRFDPAMAFRVWQREVDVYRKIWKSTILGGLADPVIYLLAMGLGLGAYVQLQGSAFAGISYAQFLAPGLLASSAIVAASNEVTWNTYVRIHQDKVYAAMLTTPASAEDIVAGELLWATTRALIYSGVMLVVLAAFGLVRSPWALLAPPAAALGGLLVAVLGLAYTSLLKHIDQVVFWYTLFVTPQFLLSGVFFPLDGLPPAVQAAAGLLPLHHAVEIARALVLGNPSMATLGHLAWLAGVTLVAWPLPSVLLKRKLVR
jgi:lipooligosaccharide transport system permease protein